MKTACVWCAFVRRCLKSIWEEVGIPLVFLLFIAVLCALIWLAGEFLEWLATVSPFLITAITVTLAIAVVVGGMFNLVAWIRDNWRKAKADCDEE